MKQSDIKIGKKVRVIDPIGTGYDTREIITCVGRIDDKYAMYENKEYLHQWVKHIHVGQIILSINKSIKTL